MSGHRGNKGPAPKVKDFKGSWKRLLIYMGTFKWLFIIAVVFAAVGNALYIIAPDKMKELTDTILNGVQYGMDFDAIRNLLLIIVGLYLAFAALSLFEGFAASYASTKLAQKMRTDISEKTNKIPLKYFDNAMTGDLMSRVTNDVDTIGQELNRSINTLVMSVTLFIGSLIMMAITNWVLMLIAIGSALLGFILLAFITSKSQKYFSRQQHNLGRMNGFISETYSSHDIVRVYNGEKDAKNKFDGINKDLWHSAFMSLFLSGLMIPLMVFMGNLGYVAVCIAGSIMVVDGQITFGVVIAFIMYVRMFTQPLQQISEAIVSMQSIAAGAERVFEFLDEEEMDDESQKTKSIKAKGKVEFRNVHFGYSPDKEIIHGFSAIINPGEKVAIVGPTGAGKTTMVNLLMRFYEVNSGEILIDDVNTREITRENVHDQFCMVLQDTWLFEGTIRENIAYCREGVTDEDVKKACEAVGLHHFVSTLPDGYNTVLNEKSTLSTGQKQQLTIARAMISKSPMLILDEATSSVDTRTEKIIQEAMDKLSEGRTSFVIAHRLSTIRNADMILVMKDGAIIEHGTHDELLANNGFYSELYNSQFEDIE